MLPSLLWIFLWFSIRVVFLWGFHPLKSSSIEVVFNGGCIPLSSSSIEVIFQWGFLPLMSCSISSVSTFPWSFSMGLAELGKNSHEFKLKKKENHRKRTSKKIIQEDNLTRRQEEGLMKKESQKCILNLSWHYKKTTFQKDRKKVLLEDDNSLPSYPILNWAWPRSAPAC